MNLCDTVAPKFRGLMIRKCGCFLFCSSRKRFRTFFLLSGCPGRIVPDVYDLKFANQYGFPQPDVNQRAGGRVKFKRLYLNQYVE